MKGQKYVDTRTLHPYVMAEHLILKLLVMNLLLKQHPPSWDNFPRDFRSCLQGLAISYSATRVLARFNYSTTNSWHHFFVNLTLCTGVS